MKGKLYLIPLPVGGADYRDVIPGNVIRITLGLRHFLAEDIRSARRYLRSVSRDFPIDDSSFYKISDVDEDKLLAGYLQPAMEGHDTGLLSEAGMPCILDPGEKIVLKAHSLGIKVVPLTGPSSVFLALAASGLNGENFRVHGYLPVQAPDLKRKISEIENRSMSGEAQVFIETPFRNQRLYGFLLDTCRPETMLCIAADITMASEEITTRTIREWKKNPPEINKRQVIYILQAGQK